MLNKLNGGDKIKTVPENKYYHCIFVPELIEVRMVYILNMGNPNFFGG